MAESLKQTLEEYRRTLGSDDRKVGDVAYELGKHLRFERPGEAKNYFQEAARIEKAHDSSKDKVAETLSFLGNAYLFASELQNAANAFDEAITLFESSLGSEHKQVATILAQKANVMLWNDDNQSAIALLQRAVKIYKSKQNVSTQEIGSLINLGNALANEGNLEEALKCCNEATMKGRSGKYHSLVTRAMQLKADIESSQQCAGNATQHM